ncbi:MAG: hypothetical protein H7X95_02135, partial [Deltaproteobacteria bacterium]|nr:hypothetical protein [Deltaproteobacteria bacterium]
MNRFTAGCSLIIASLLFGACGGTASGTRAPDGGSDSGVGAQRGTGGQGAGGGGTATRTGGAPGGFAGSTGNGGTAGSGPVGCQTGGAQCNNCVDDDRDGLIDTADPECVGSTDNDESTFGTGIPGDNSDACKQDGFFDGDSGMGNDGCEWNLKCDPLN